MKRYIPAYVFSMLFPVNYINVYQNERAHYMGMPCPSRKDSDELRGGTKRVYRLVVRMKK